MMSHSTGSPPPGLGVPSASTFPVPNGRRAGRLARRGKSLVASTCA